MKSASISQKKNTTPNNAKESTYNVRFRWESGKNCSSHEVHTTNLLMYGLRNSIYCATK